MSHLISRPESSGALRSVKQREALMYGGPKAQTAPDVKKVKTFVSFLSLGGCYFYASVV